MNKIFYLFITYLPKRTLNCKKKIIFFTDTPLVSKAVKGFWRYVCIVQMMSRQILITLVTVVQYHFLKRKLLKVYRQVCIEKSPDCNLSIHPRWKQFHWLYEYTLGFVKCFDTAVFCSFWNSQVSCESNKTIIFTVLNAFFIALNFRLWLISQSFDY